MAMSYLWIPISLYFAGWLAESMHNVTGTADLGPWPRRVLAAAFVTHGVLVVALIVVSEPLRLTQPILLAGTAWFVVAGYYGLMRRWSSAVFPLILPPLAIALLLTAIFTTEPSLKHTAPLGLSISTTRHILTAHILSVLAGMLLFGLGCIVSILYLYQERRLKAKLTELATSRVPPLGALEGYNHRAITLGFFFMTVGLLLGLVVAGISTLPHRLASARQLIPTGVWLMYAVFLIAHDLQGRRGRFGAVWSIVGFAVMLTSFAFEIVYLMTRI